MTKPNHSRRHREDFSALGVAAWLGCPACQRGRQMTVTLATASAISAIVTAIAPCTVTGGGMKPLEGGGTQ